MFPTRESAQLAKHYEAEKRRIGHQKVERGFSGAGYWYGGYPVYIGAMMLGDMSTAMPVGDQAQPDLDSKVTNAAAEVTGPDSNAGMAANTAPAGA